MFPFFFHNIKIDSLVEIDGALIQAVPFHAQCKNNLWNLLPKDVAMDDSLDVFFEKV